MNIGIISYSYTGNNKALAGNVAKELSAGHIQVSEDKSRSMGAIILDMVFSRTPQVHPAPDKMKEYDLILFFAPVWMGHIASPLRPYFQYLKEHPGKYGFISISGGADGANSKLREELNKRTGTDPAVILDLHIADLLPSNPKPARKDTSAYRLKEKDITKLTDMAVKEVKKII